MTHRGRAARGEARQFSGAIEEPDIRSAVGYLRRGDFSGWIGDVFGDHALVRARYDLTEESFQAVGSCRGTQALLGASPPSTTYERPDPGLQLRSSADTRAYVSRMPACCRSTTRSTAGARSPFIASS